MIATESTLVPRLPHPSSSRSLATLLGLGLTEVETRVTGWTSLPRNTWREVLDHWERLLLNPWTDIPTSRNCMLCRRYKALRDEIDPDSFAYCSLGCPVFVATGNRLCDGTPYEDAANDFDDVYRASWLVAVWREYRFLVHLYRRFDAAGLVWEG